MATGVQGCSGHSLGFRLIPKLPSCGAWEGLWKVLTSVNSAQGLQVHPAPSSCQIPEAQFL